MNESQVKYYFFLGIGGIGMSALARYLNLQGYRILGYDMQKTNLTQTLETQGIKVFYQDDENNIPDDLNKDNTIVVLTPAIRTGNLLNFFKNHGFTILKRAELLASIVNDSRLIAISGTHGKTTTTAITAHIFKLAGKLNVGFVGGITKNYKSNFIRGNGQFSVVEADEYDRAFLLLKPDFAIITSIEPDHLDIYQNYENLKQAFVQFVKGSKQNAKILINKNIQLQGLNREVYYYSVSDKADFYVSNIHHCNHRQYFVLHLNDTDISTYIRFPGKAYLENALAAAAIAYLSGIEPKIIKQALETYLGTDRRFDLKYSDSVHYIYDDYAHHPTEIQALYQSVSLFHPDKHLTIAFQPHLYSRTRDFAEQFGLALSKFDKVIVTDIYPAREKPIPGVNPQLILKYVKHQNKQYVPFKNLVDFLQKQDFEVLLITGAGNINTIIPELVKQLKNIYENK